MSKEPRVRVNLATSLDGFIASPNNNIDWMHRSHARDGDLPHDDSRVLFKDFLGEVGAILMGRTTYDVVEKIGMWPYGPIPSLVATTRPIKPIDDVVSPICGDIHEMIAKAKEIAGEKDVFLDGGSMVTQALNADLIDEFTITYFPIILGEGLPLFQGISGQVEVQFVNRAVVGKGLVQFTVNVIHKDETAEKDEDK